ncbi:MAG: hypothetical protein EOP63_12535 [Sphingomonadales bacterium]|nr:MAG: hypothetical protein EOP63_12535 [Sphingomonadales bacterium]
MQALEGLDAKPSQRLWDRHASPISIIVLGALLLAAALGFTGGQPSSPRTADLGDARLTVKTPTVIRNGEFFETDITLTANVPLGDAVVAVSPALWQDMTVNTMIPAPAEESFENGLFHFSYGPLAAGDTLRIKIDGQINPPLFAGTMGEIAILDGSRRIGAMPLRIRVLP